VDKGSTPFLPTKTPEGIDLPWLQCKIIVFLTNMVLIVYPLIFVSNNTFIQI